jgi:hypothetical protein
MEGVEETYKIAVLNNRLLYYILEGLYGRKTAQDVYKYAYDSVYSKEKENDNGAINSERSGNEPESKER